MIIFHIKNEEILKWNPSLCVCVACKIVECKSVRDPMSFVLQKHSGEPLNRIKYPKKKQKCVARSIAACFPCANSMENISNKNI